MDDGIAKAQTPLLGFLADLLYILFYKKRK